MICIKPFLDYYLNKHYTRDISLHFYWRQRLRFTLGDQKHPSLPEHCWVLALKVLWSWKPLHPSQIGIGWSLSWDNAS